MLHLYRGYASQIRCLEKLWDVVPPVLELLVCFISGLALPQMCATFHCHTQAAARWTDEHQVVLPGRRFAAGAPVDVRMYTWWWAVPPLHVHLVAHLVSTTAVIHGETVDAEVQIKGGRRQEHGPAAPSEVRKVCKLLLHARAVISWLSAVATVSPSLLVAWVRGDERHHDTALPICAVPDPAVSGVAFARKELQHGLYATPAPGTFISQSVLTGALEDLLFHHQPTSPYNNSELMGIV